MKKETRDLIRKSAVLRNKGLRVTDIATELEISFRRASLYSRGLVSYKNYQREYSKFRKFYTFLIEYRLDDLVFLGWPIEMLTFDRVGIIHFEEKNVEVSRKLEDLKESLEKNIRILELGKSLFEGIDVKYWKGVYYLRPRVVEARAFLKPYSDIVLEREVINNSN